MNRIIKKIIEMIRKIAVVITTAFINFITIFTKVEDDLIIFESFFGRSITDNPLAIYEHIDKSKYRCFFLVNNPDDYPNFLTIKRKTIKSLIYLRKAKIVISNSRMPRYWIKRKEQVYIQTWHGTPLKRLVHDLENFNMPSAKDKTSYFKMFDRDVKRWDYLISSCEYATKCFKTAFNYQGEILEIGYPRNNKLYYYTSNDILKIKQKLNIPLTKKIILYAPTYRDNKNRGIGDYYFEDILDYKLLEQELSNTLILVRYHYAIKETNLKNYTNVMDVSNYQDMSELFLISDILITDYSSVLFDYSILKRPFLFFAPDIDEYKKELRGFYLDMNSDFPTAPVKTTQELVAQIKNTNDLRYKIFSSKYNPSANRDSIEQIVHLIDNIVLKNDCT